MALLNYTTKTDATQTIGEIQKLLSGHGVTAMMTEYDGPNVSAVSFRLNVGDKPMSFKLPCNWRGVLEIMKNDRLQRVRYYATQDQAIRTAWRIIFEWIRAQLALVEVNMVTIPQVFLPYAIMKDGRTLSEHVESDSNFLLGKGN